MPGYIKLFIYAALCLGTIAVVSCSTSPTTVAGLCSQHPQYQQFDSVKEPLLANGWGNGLHNARYQSIEHAGLNIADIPRLKLKWAFKFPNADSPRSQPAVTRDTVYVGSEAGKLFALDKASGCIKWHQQINTSIRTAIVLADVSPELRLIFFGDKNAVIHAVNAQTGEHVWERKMDSHQAAVITGAPQYHNGRLYVPVSSLEVLKAMNPFYQCCTFRGSVVAVAAKSGDFLWQTYTVAEATKKDKNKIGVQQWGPSGAPVWNTPTIDVKRKRLYVGTGENYSSPASKLSDAVIAMDLDDGNIVWSKQLTPNDVWNMSCALPVKLSCPKEPGLDLDIGAAIVLVTTNGGEELLITGQKSGIVYALDPGAQGNIVWQQKLGRGGALGGVHWGMAADAESVYVPISDMDLNKIIIVAKNPKGEKQPGLNALDLASGTLNWHYRQAFKCKNPSDCDTGLSSPPTVMPGVVFTGTLDGELKAFATATGSLLWAYDTTQKVNTVSGETGHGGAIDVDGPVIAGGQVFIHSGYKMMGAGQGNVLLSFSVDGK